jgi:hypothetical protein
MRDASNRVEMHAAVFAALDSAGVGFINGGSPE